MIEIKFHPEIYQELKESYDWYEENCNGLGDDFLNELDTAWRVIQDMPKAWPVISMNFRRYLLRRFPFGIIYRLTKDIIYVVAVMHLSRKPGYWIERVKK